MDNKQTIIDALDTLRKRDVADKQPFKAKAYEKVIKQLRDYKGAIYTIDDVSGMTGIGEKIREKIVEILETGSLASAERILASGKLTALDTFQAIYGVGPAKASALVAAGYKTIEELRKAVAVDPKLLNENQRVGLAYYEDLLERIPRKEMGEHETILQNHVGEFTIGVVGSYRRGVASSGDVDVLLKMDSAQGQEQFKTYIEALQKSSYIDVILAQGPKKCMAICHIGDGCRRRLDLLYTPIAEYAYALLYFTGSDKFNVAFRAHALECGYTLNEHTMVPIRTGVVAVPPMCEEKDIFVFLGVRYVEPCERIDEGQIIKLRKKPTIIR